MNKRNDLTRWNRAGLKHFRYVDGNAVSFLECLRQALTTAYTDDNNQSQWPQLTQAIPVTPGESVAERRQRLLQQYRAPRRDYLWEITRAQARSLHILGEYIDAYANENYLGTATQWDNLRKLVAMLDYQPAPPASATTVIALLAKAGRRGDAAMGIALKNSPPPGEPTVIFETLEELAVDAALNHIRGRDWDRSPVLLGHSVNSAGETLIDLPLDDAPEGVAAGSRGVLLKDHTNGQAVQGWAVRVTAVSDESIQVAIAASASAPGPLTRSQTRLLLKPRQRQQAQLSGDNVLRLAGAHGLSTGQVIAWASGGVWRAARVLQVDGLHIQLEGSQLPAAGAAIYRVLRADMQELTVAGSARQWTLLPLAEQRLTTRLWNSALTVVDAAEVQTHSDGGSAIFDYLASGISVYYLAAETAALTSVVAVAPQALTLTGDPGPLGAGQWLLVEENGEWRAARVTALDVAQQSFTLGLDITVAGVSALQHQFGLSLRPRGHDRNPLPLATTGPQGGSRIDLDDVPHPLLARGRRLLVVSTRHAQAVRIREVRTAEQALIVEPPLLTEAADGEGFSSVVFAKADTIIYANAVLAGHGETQAERILGSGDATQTGQVFPLEATEVSYVADSSFPSGVRAAVEITVDGRTWQQQPRLAEAEPEAAVYALRTQEDGTQQVLFGNGWHGRRLPTGINNIRIRHRQGHGLSGNLAAGSLSKLVRPVAFLQAAIQPLAATGGNDVENSASLRANAPATVLTLERAVSLSDFTHLATAQSGVWQARAHRRQPGAGRSEWIEVVVVPAGGGPLGDLTQTLAATLETHALPGVRVTINPYQPVMLEARIQVRIKAAEYESELVLAAVAEQLQQQFGIRRMRLGSDFYRSQLVAAVEQVTGVENARVEINPWGFVDDQGTPVQPRQVIGAGSASDPVRRISLRPAQLLYLDPRHARLELSSEDYSL
ncbi:MAG: hypothetical protein Tsb002_21280 [Wenzhouxiangellaceae bacterium]